MDLIWIGKVTPDGRVKIFQAKEDHACAMAEFFKFHNYFFVYVDTDV